MNSDYISGFGIIPHEATFQRRQSAARRAASRGHDDDTAASCRNIVAVNKVGCLLPALLKRAARHTRRHDDFQRQKPSSQLADEGRAFVYTAAKKRRPSQVDTCSWLYPAMPCPWFQPRRHSARSPAQQPFDGPWSAARFRQSA